MNYFNSDEVAKRYLEARPRYHDIVVRRIKRHLKMKQKISLTLDVACGTGLSTIPLTEISKWVVGLDASQAMLNNALQNDCVIYRKLEAEKLDFPEDSIELITAASGVHWMDTTTFLKRSNELLTPTGCLAIYDNYFLGNLQGDENADFKQWFSQKYLKQFASPARNKFNFTPDVLGDLGFTIFKNDQFENNIRWSKHQLKRYLATQSNVIAKVSEEKYTFAEVEEWLDDELSVFFEAKRTQTFVFSNWLLLLRKMI